VPPSIIQCEYPRFTQYVNQAEDSSKRRHDETGPRCPKRSFRSRKDKIASSCCNEESNRKRHQHWMDGCRQCLRCFLDLTWAPHKSEGAPRDKAGSVRWLIAPAMALYADIRRLSTRKQIYAVAKLISGHDP
jgi:hypothetical protein